MHPVNHINKLTRQIIRGNDLERQQAEHAFQIIMSGGASPAQIASFLTALTMKGETVDEITGAVAALRSKAAPFNAPDNAIDTCGTGGDNSATYNISTAVAFVVAGAGVPVAKHGNKAISSVSGSSDVLRALEIGIDAPMEVMQKALEECGIAFLFAPLYHSAMRHVGTVRQELGFRTIFNLLGPLSNPANTKRQLIGVYDKRWLEPLAHVVGQLGLTKAWIVHGSDGLDELTTTGESYVAEWHNGTVRSFIIHPEELGLELAKPSYLKGEDAGYNAEALRRVLNGEQGPYRDIVLLNAAAALVVADEVDSLTEGITRAEASIDSRKARDALYRLSALTYNHDTHAGNADHV